MSERSRAEHAAQGLPGFEGASRQYFPRTLRLHHSIPPHRPGDMEVLAPQEGATAVHDLIDARVTRVRELLRRRDGAGLNPLGPQALRKI